MCLAILSKQGIGRHTPHDVEIKMLDEYYSCCKWDTPSSSPSPLYDTSRPSTYLVYFSSLQTYSVILFFHFSTLSSSTLRNKQACASIATYVSWNMVEAHSDLLSSEGIVVGNNRPLSIRYWQPNPDYYIFCWLLLLISLLWNSIDASARNLITPHCRLLLLIIVPTLVTWVHRLKWRWLFFCDRRRLDE